MKKTIAFILCMFLIGALVACMPTSTPTPTTAATPTVGTTELTIGIPSWGKLLDKDGADVLAKIYSAYETIDPNVKVKIDYYAWTDWADYTTKIQSLFAAGTSPDLVYCPAETENAFFEGGLTLPLTNYLKKNPDKVAEYESQVSEAFRALARHNDEYYGIVQLWEYDVVWINNAIFKAANATIPNETWTWAEFENACNLIEKNTDAYAFLIPNSYYVNGGWLYSFGTGYLDDAMKEVTFDSPASKELVQFYSDSIKKGWASADFLNLDFNVEFLNGRSAMLPAGRWPMAFLNDNKFTDVTVARIPVKYSDRQQAAWASMQVCKGTKNYEAAAALAVYTGGFDFCIEYLKVNTCIPVRTDLNKPENYLFEFNGMDVFLKPTDKLVKMQNPYYFADLETIWKACLTSVFSGDKTVDEAVNDAAAEMRDAAK